MKDELLLCEYGSIYFHSFKMFITQLEKKKLYWKIGNILDSRRKNCQVDLLHGMKQYLQPNSLHICWAWPPLCFKN